ncbi:MAG: outer membrane lipoprotein-sorting protein [Deltaproteobacteria bacterium]|nr:outer membrane lipoprotein-sorting protein [Deltaproteobacteria bacterium]
MPMRIIGWVVVAGAFLSLGANARGESLREFLQSVESAATPTVPLRADGTIEISSDAGSIRDRIALVLRSPGDIYIELRDDGTRALILDDGSRAVRAAKGSGADELAGDAVLAGSDFTREDLQPLRVARFSDMRISDDSNGELTAALFPTKSQYTLLAMTFDRQKKVPIKTIYYRDTLNNAVKMERFGGYEQVGGKWLPATISMESFRLKTHTTLTLHWTANPPLSPGLFEADSLSRPSQLEWPASAVTMGK